MNSVFSALAIGSICGIVNGFLSRYFLKKVIDKKDKIFYSVFIGGIFYRLLFLLVSIWLLYNKKAIILIVFSVSLIFFQFIFEVKPIKNIKTGTENGTQRNT